MTSVKSRMIDADTVRITLARPERRNALNGEMAAKIAAAAAAAVAGGSRIALLDAEGPAFCAGGDLGDLDDASRAIDSVMMTLLNTPLHWTAVVDGPARGGALSILAACPRVIATTNASFGLPELAQGFFPTTVMSAQVGMVGVRHAFDLAFTAQPINAPSAQAIGLVNDVVDADVVDDVVLRYTGALLALDPDGLRRGVSLWQSHARLAHESRRATSHAD